MSPRKPDLSHITPDLQSLAVPLKGLAPDPQNARTHDERNLDAIAGSLRQFGQRTPIVVQVVGRKRIVRKGNGTVEAARRLGWTHLAAVKVREDDQSATGYAIADNRTSELAGWDEQQLAELLDGLDLGDESLVAMAADLTAEVLQQVEAEAAAEPQPAPAGGSSEAEDGDEEEPEPAPRNRRKTEPDAPEQFPEVGEDLPTKHECPQCGYRWS